MIDQLPNNDDVNNIIKELLKKHKMEDIAKEMRQGPRDLKDAVKNLATMSQYEMTIMLIALLNAIACILVSSGIASVHEIYSLASDIFAQITDSLGDDSAQKS